MTGITGELKEEKGLWHRDAGRMLGLGQGTCKGPEARKTVHSRDLGVSASAPECTRLFVSTQPVLTWREDSLSPRAAARALREQEELVWDQLVQAEA